MVMYLGSEDMMWDDDFWMFNVFVLEVLIEDVIELFWFVECFDFFVIDFEECECWVWVEVRKWKRLIMMFVVEFVFWFFVDF